MKNLNYASTLFRVHSSKFLILIRCIFLFYLKCRDESAAKFRIPKYRKFKTIKIINNSLFERGDLLTNSGFLLSNLLPPRPFNINYFSVEHNFQKSDLVFPYMSLIIPHFQVGTFCSCGSSQIFLHECRFKIAHI